MWGERPRPPQLTLVVIPTKAKNDKPISWNDEAYFFVHWSTQSFTVLYQSCEFCGFITQWPSSGK